MSIVSDIRKLTNLLVLNTTMERSLHRRHARLMHIKVRVHQRAQAWRKIRYDQAQQRQRRIAHDWHALLGRRIASTELATLASSEAWNLWETQHADRSEQLWRSRLQACLSQCMDVESRLQVFHKRGVTLDAMKRKWEARLADERERLDEEAAMDLAAFRHIREQ